ncbi:MAG: molybdate ABC transporter substrate-binding protein [Rhodospirillaceae bacterium]|nr:molybdate ABC transporter substrate-binding protein [Rhodospirillaceae bacterium]MBL6930457.1 molybdate ABC transporter substrate-binding protein [Rhodospirillales bacterium]MBL6942185.1 molybdate ABC transporter substrate-binding protein [Rhodospirillales bacterium]
MKLSYRLKGAVLGLLLAVICSGPVSAQSGPIIAVAANLRFVIEEVARSFYDESGISVRFSFGSSGNLSRQIIQGAPFEMFMSADEDYVFRVSEAGASADRGKIYAVGRIAAYAPKGSPLQQVAFPAGYVGVLNKQTKQRFAIANPDLAPYGRAAKEALEHAGLWQAMRPRLIYGENISQTAQFILSGSTFGGIIAYAQALSSPFKENGDYQLIPASWHKPIAQRMVLLNRSGDTTRRFYAYLSEVQAVAIFQKYGFTVP